ncbi:hypothetical protein [Bradyrhizobium sp. AUGA SZCCT0160]|uniref:hypothetical protein n=1 Tax=Bradyrhizobium sp. AUGA SZCCT0160 TaxID=2807662 RepID=UPI001BA71DE9|nr:hypothetical protein [Bradyrhizobium sp. AUGA SZCCT0160]MBR1189757.1 hypothetical protein [Bradyrhizobium sp. AUGA SZCCT0160]
MITLETRIVAFVDLLGYKEMVIHDSEAAAGANQYVDKLYKISKQVKGMVDPAIDLKFFSDCVVLSTAPVFASFQKICKACRDLQSQFLAESILVRGGISFGKHFSDADFLFSRGLVDAYLLEVEKARTPRIIVSPDLMDLFQEHATNFLVRERDGLAFVDYLDPEDRNQIEIAQSLIDRGIGNPILAEKLIWLGEYVNFRFGTASIKLADRFSS